MAKIKVFPVSKGVEIVTIGSKAYRCTIGYRRINRMIQVAVSYCAPDDKWKTKAGRNVAFDRLEGAISYGLTHGVISLPMGRLDDEEIQDVLSGMFFGCAND